ncbi:Asp23/Gls24 family envelope stress response protein [Arthrobacter halodurans]|uniref:Asp23 family, cell envelope-related function n=1 Tax=Arthrobacter halodurans TaxID=516699 RepID=A0ABV4USS0_9MICC
MARPEPVGPAAPGDRGRLTISERAVGRLAAKSAASHPAVGARTGGVLGIGSDTDFASLPPASCTVAGNTASVSVRIGLRFPADIRGATDEVRRGIVEDLRRFAGVTAAPVDIQVEWLEAAPPVRRVL